MTRNTFALSLCLLLGVTACGSQLSESQIAARSGSLLTQQQGDSSGSSAPGSTTPGSTTPGTTGEASAAPGVTGPSTAASLAAGSQKDTGTGTAPGTPAGGASTAPGAAPAVAQGGPDIVVGNVGTVSGLAGAALATVQRGVQIWAKFVNAHGGINGRQVRLVTADDNASTGNYQQLVKQMVESDHVVAFVGNEDALTESSSTMQYLESKNIPIVGTDMGNTLNYSSRILFPQGTAGTSSATLATAVWVKAGLADGKHKFGLVTCQEVAVCNDLYSKWDTNVAKYGGQPVYKAQTSLGQPSFTSECLAAQQAGVEVLAYVGDSNSFTRLARSCRGQGVTATFAGPASIVVASQAADSNFAGSYISTQFTPWVLSATPAQKDFQDAFKRYVGGDASGGDMTGWVAGKLFEASLRGQTGTITGPSVIEGLYQLSKETLGGLTGPLTFTRQQPATPILCGTVMKINGGVFTASGTGALTCY